MLVHLSALARAALCLDAATAEERELILELEALLSLRLVDPESGALTVDAVRLAPLAGATLGAAGAFFELAESLGGEAPALSGASVGPQGARLATVTSDAVRSLHR